MDKIVGAHLSSLHLNSNRAITLILIHMRINLLQIQMGVYPNPLKSNLNYSNLDELYPYPLSLSTRWRMPLDLIHGVAHPFSLVSHEEKCGWYPHPLILSRMA